ncbi:MAG: DsbA family oxidoreductase [Solibacillus sp.]
MKIEVWSDYVCPFCYIGKRQLEQVIAASGYEGQIDVQFKSYLLDPTTPVDTESSVREELQRKYNLSAQDAKNMTENVTARAQEVGLTYNFDDMKSANTVAAHRLTKWAEKKGVGAAFNERLLNAYFLEGAAIGKADVLVTLAKEVGLDEKEALQVFHSTNYAAEVEQDIHEAQQLGVRGVPFFVLDNKYGISGAQPKEIFEQTIEKAATEAGLRKKLQMQGNASMSCTDDSCDL